MRLKLKMEKNVDNMKKINRELFICSCHSTEHQIIVTYEDDEINGVKYPILYIHTHLNKKPFWKRLKYGIKYIFGYQSRYGAFDEFIVNPDDIVGLEKMIKHLKECQI